MRQLIPDFTATLLRDVYDYTITLPSTINTFYANLNRSTDDLVVRGDPDDAEDVITVNEVGSNVRVLVNGTSEQIASSAVDLITIFGQEGNDYINVDQTPEGIPTSANAGLGDDVITIANASGNLTFVDGDVTANGGPGMDVLNIQDLGRTGNQTYHITSSTITPNGLGYSINYLNFDNVFLQGEQGDSIFNIDGIAFNTAVHVYGQNGDDTFNVGGVSLLASLDGIPMGALLTTNGGNDLDAVRFNDGAQIGSTSYTLSNVNLARTGLSSPIAYSNMESVLLQAGSGNDLIDVVRTSVPTTVNGNGGSDTVSVGNGDIDSNITSDLTLLGGLPLGPNDHVILEDEFDTNNDNYFLDGDTFQKFNFIGSLTYDSSFELVTLNANPHNNNINVDGVVANRLLTVNGLGGNDDIYVGDGDIDSNIRGDVSVNGGIGSDELFLQDSIDQVGADTYTITANTFDKTSYNGMLDYTFVDQMTLYANAFNNSVNINSTSAGTAVVVHGNAGNDAFHVNAPPQSQVTVHGGDPLVSPGDSLSVIGTATSAGSYRPSDDTPGNGVVTVDGVDIVFTGLEPVTASVFNTFTIVTPNVKDILRIEEDVPGQNVIRGTSDNVAFEELIFFDVMRFVVDMATNDVAGSVDSLVVSAGDMPATGVESLVVNAGTGTNSLLAESGITNLNTSIGTELGRNLDTTVSGASTRVNFLQSQDLRSLAITTGLVSLEPNNAQTVLLTPALAITGGSRPTGTLDLHDNGLIVDYVNGGISPYSGLRNQIIHARNQNAPTLWTGSGITSSVAALDAAHAAVGYAEAHRLFNGNNGAFMGQSLAAGNRAVLIRATRMGDANLDGVTDGSDFSQWNANKFGPGDWLQGDFNYDDVVDGSDFNAWNANKFQAFDQNAIGGRPDTAQLLPSSIHVLLTAARPMNPGDRREPGIFEPRDDLTEIIDSAGLNRIRPLMSVERRKGVRTQ